MDLRKRAARTFTLLPNGWMSIKTFGHGGWLVNERIVPLAEGRQIEQGFRTKEPKTGPYHKID